VFNQALRPNRQVDLAEGSVAQIPKITGNTENQTHAHRTTKHFSPTTL
jgi:NAD(P)H-nitrite reductase large subunit